MAIDAMRGVKEGHCPGCGLNMLGPLWEVENLWYEVGGLRQSCCVDIAKAKDTWVVCSWIWKPRVA